MRTIAYVDGYNFYYGVLKNSPYKWLDIVGIVKEICRIQNPNLEVVTVKFFTAPVRSNVATRGEQSVHSQDTYHRALLSTYPQSLEIINGYHLLERGSLPRYQKPINKQDRIDVWRLEEKQTDVNIALHIYRDALIKICEHAVLVSSDSDLEPVLRFLKNDCPEHHIGLILPRREQSGETKQRPPNDGLSKLSDWTRTYVLNTELEKFQLPERVHTGKKPATKPSYW